LIGLTENSIILYNLSAKAEKLNDDGFKDAGLEVIKTENLYSFGVDILVFALRLEYEVLIFIKPLV
jgi:hypothetical protein